MGKSKKSSDEIRRGDVIDTHEHAGNFKERLAEFEVVKQEPNFKSHWDNPRVEQNHYGFCSKPVLFSTEGLGPCIGVCIARKKWAGICHLGSHDEYDLLPEFVTRAKEFIPENVVPEIYPVICGGDPFHDAPMSSEREEYAKNVLESRKRVIEVLKEAGFGKPRIRWNNERETTSLLVDLKAGFVYIENNIGKMWKSPICTT
jgi:hypothetical protein